MSPYIKLDFNLIFLEALIQVKISVTVLSHNFDYNIFTQRLLPKKKLNLFERTLMDSQK